MNDRKNKKINQNQSAKQKIPDAKQLKNKAESGKKRKTPERGLGRGLSALLSDTAVRQSLVANEAISGSKARIDSDDHLTLQLDTPNDGLIPIDLIEPTEWQPRKSFDSQLLKELAASLKSHGIIQPLLVRPHPSHPARYQLIAGERRWRAAQLAQIHQVPVVIRDTTDRQAAEMALIENIQRRDLTPIEEAEGFQRLIDEFNHTQEKLATIIGKSRSYLTNTIRLLKLPEQVRSMINDRILSPGQVRPLIGHEDAVKMAETIVRNDLNARQAEAMIATKGRARPRQRQRQRESDLVMLEKDIADALGLDVRVDFNRLTLRGKITINCRSLDQFDMAIKNLTSRRN